MLQPFDYRVCVNIMVIDAGSEHANKTDIRDSLSSSSGLSAAVSADDGGT
jgi:hypothetical protein